MLEGLNAIDWNKLNAPELPKMLKDLAFETDRAKRYAALEYLTRFLVPWELLYGYAYEELWDQLDMLMDNDIPSAAIPFLIDIVQHVTDHHVRMYILEMLHDICRYANIPDNWPDSLEFGKRLRAWGMHLRELVRAGMELYQSLLVNEEPDMRIMAADVIGVLNE